MLTVYLALIAMVCLLAIISTYRSWSHLKKSPQVKIPARHKRLTMFDVRHFLMEGEKDLAIQVYAKIFQMSIHQAKKDVEELQRSLKV